MKTNLDMTKVYRAELRDLKRNKTAVQRGLRKVSLGSARTLKQLARAHRAEAQKVQRALSLANRAATKATARINQRIAILEGRLS